MRVPPTGLPIAAYPFCTEIDVRLTDLDFARHVNNAAVAAFHEEVRVRFHVRHFGADTVFNRPSGGGVVAQVSIQYLRESVHGLSITGCVGVARLGNSSYTLSQALFQGGHCFSEATCVIAQRENGHAEPLSDALRGRLSALMVAANPS